ncbi:MAG: tetratricopeptide repeat protein [Candidatus Glassbacteria bacterium]|nr:tetratricopeptide repeat protein [Candidatus Glassbacteria bacterium]
MSAGAARLDDRRFNELRQLSRTIADQAGPERPIPILLQHQDDPRVLGLLLEYYGKAERQLEFLEIAAEQAARQPLDLAVQGVYLKALHAAGMADSVMPVASRIIGSAPDTLSEVWRVVGSQLAELGMHAAALEVFNRGRAAAAGGSAFAREIALELADLGLLNEAVEELLAMVRGNPAESTHPRQVAYRITSRGRQAEDMLLERLDDALKSAGGEVEKSLRSLLMELCLSAGLEKEAYGYFSSLLRKLDDRAARRIAQLFIGRAARLSLFDSALSGYALADSLKLVNHQTALLGQAEILLRLGRYQQAEHHFIELIGFESTPIAAMAWRKLGDIYLNRMDRPGEALACYRKLEELGGLEKEQLLDAKLRIAESFIRLERLDDAGALCRELLDSSEYDPLESSGAMLLLGDVLFFGGQPDSAAEAYLTFAKLNLGDQLANDAMGKIYLIRHDRSPEGGPSRKVGEALYAARNGNVQLARDLFAGLLREQSDSLYRAQVYYQMGRMYERESEFSLALGTYGQLIDELPGHQLAPLAELRMGIILLEEVADTTRARGHLERVVVEYPLGVATPQARRLLRTLDDEKL